MLVRTMVLMCSLSLFAPAFAAAPQGPEKGAAKPATPAKRDKVAATAEAIVEQPFRDINVIKDKIPPRLLAIMDAPYDIRRLRTCAAMIRDVRALTAIIGPDVDSPEVRRKKGKISASEFVLDGARMAAGGIVPFSGLVRKVSGAEAAQKRAQAAILAGHIRRAYIKGVMRQQGCS